MGCITSRIIVDDASRPVFHVWNIDEDGHYIKSCHIQVTETDLVLHQRGESPIVWPLQSLRRYGFDTELFSFECGRRCTTGPGIYAFKCKEAEALFNALQECLLVPRSDSEVALSSGNGDDTEQPSSIGGEADSTGTGIALIKESKSDKIAAVFDLGFEPQPGPSTINGIPTLPLTRDVIPTAPVATPSLMPTPSKKQKRSRQRAVSLTDSEKDLPPLLDVDYGGAKFLPRCCAIGTCINASNQHYMNDSVLRKTTCGSCRTCSLNMCVTHLNANSVTYSDRAKQTDYGNVLDPTGHPRQCVHCCCDFKPKQKMGCSADNCPLHFNNCVDQITNYSRIDSHQRQEHSEKATLRKEKLYQMQQPHSHLYTNIPIPIPKWPKTKSMSWRSLPQFGAASSLSRLAPKRSTSHFYANVSDASKEKYYFSKTKSKADLEQKTSYLKLDLEEKNDSNGSLAVLSSLSNSPNRSDPDMYAKIDFEKTVALSTTAHQTFDLHDESTRMTRHNNMSSAGTQT